MVEWGWLWKGGWPPRKVRENALYNLNWIILVGFRIIFNQNRCNNFRLCTKHKPKLSLFRSQREQSFLGPLAIASRHPIEATLNIERKFIKLIINILVCKQAKMGTHGVIQPEPTCHAR